VWLTPAAPASAVCVPPAAAANMGWRNAKRSTLPKFTVLGCYQSMQVCAVVGRVVVRWGCVSSGRLCCAES